MHFSREGAYCVPVPPRSDSAHRLGTSFFASIAIGAAVLGLSLLPSTPQRATLVTPVDIGVEHAQPLLLLFNLGLGKTGAIVDVTARSTDAALVSLPSDWTLREVRHASLEDVRHDPPALGTVRWHLPAHATLSFLTSALPGGAVVHNPSKVQLEVRVTRVDLPSGKTTSDTYLLKDDPLRIW